MSDDPRLVAWLEAGAAALAAPPEERLDALCAAIERRAELARALEAEPATGVSDALAARLVEGEAALRAALEGERDRLAAQLGAVRDSARANHGYRPARGSDPAFVSRSV